MHKYARTRTQYAEDTSQTYIKYLEHLHKICTKKYTRNHIRCYFNICVLGVSHGTSSLFIQVDIKDKFSFRISQGLSLVALCIAGFGK
jgi:hypothetical protein